MVICKSLKGLMMNYKKVLSLLSVLEKLNEAESKGTITKQELLILHGDAINA